MIKPLNALIIEDHPLLTRNYKSALSLQPDHQFNVDIAHDADTALIKIHGRDKLNFYDLVVLDISIPPSKNKLITSGEDLGLEIRKHFSQTKIIVITAYNESYRLNNIIKSINPEAFLIKCDIEFIDLVNAIKAVLKDYPYYSKTVLSIMRNRMSHDIILDNKDRTILYELSMGTRMKELAEIVSLSVPGLEGRKQRLKEAFDVRNNNDRVLIEKARKAGFV